MIAHRASFLPPCRGPAISDSVAIFAARFQPYHLGHHSLVRALLAQVPDRVFLAVVVSERPDLAGRGRSLLDRMAPEHHTSERNFLPPWDNCDAIRAVWADEPEGSRVVVGAIPRPQGPESWWSFVKSFLPSDRYWVLKWDDEFERAKRQFFEGAGERTFQPIAVAAEDITVRGDGVRREIARGADVSRLVPPDVIPLIKRMADGVE